ncbi:MAG: efflux RND transporter permease subunit, partial [Chitinophagaceae bacterium]
MKIAEISIKRPTLVIVLFIVLILGGILSYTSLGYELLPKFSPSVVSVVSVYPGASPAEVENTVTKKVEEAVSAMENIKKLEARSFESVSIVTITLKSGSDVDYALNDAQRRINSIQRDLPEDLDPPTLNKFSLDDLPVMTISSSAKLDEAAFYD